VREWKQRDWGGGGDDFHWWCTAAPDAFVGAEPVYVTLREELVEIASQRAYDLLVTHIVEAEVAARSGSRTAFLPHPAVRRKGSGA
jgi:hypothetical protein